MEQLIEQLIFVTLLVILSFDYLLERWLDYLNVTKWSSSLPNLLKGIYNEEEYSKSQAYQKANHRFGMLTSTFSFLLIVVVLLTGGFALANTWAESISTNTILNALIFFAIIGLASELLTLPFEIYDTFVLEERFGFNKTTVKTFVLDKIKGLSLSAILGGGLMSLIILIWMKTGSYFWLLAWGFITAISVFFALFYSNLIVPLFNKQTPLPDGELKEAIEEFSLQAGFKLNNIFVIDGSKRSTKANAYFTGFGPKKRIVLYDTLIADLSTDEIVAVLAHEIGHYKKKHVFSSIVTGILQTGIMLYIFSLLVNSPILSGALGVNEPKFHIGLIVFGILYSPISFGLGILMNIVSRKNEYQADAFAAQFGLSEHLGNALKKLSVKSLSNLTPHPLYVFFHYSHPTLLQRLEKLNK